MSLLAAASAGRLEREGERSGSWRPLETRAPSAYGPDTYRDYQQRGLMFSPIQPLVTFARQTAPDAAHPGLGDAERRSTRDGYPSRARLAEARTHQDGASNDARPSLIDRTRWLGETVLLAYLFAIALLVLGLPVALAIRGGLSVTAWLAAALS